MLVIDNVLSMSGGNFGTSTLTGGLLICGITKIMSEVYSNLLKSPHWQKKRLEVMSRDNFECRFCGDKESTLNVHHVVYLSKRKPWEYDDAHLITICEKCHTDEEKLKAEDPFLINMFSMSGLSRRKLYSLASALGTHFRHTRFKDGKFGHLMDYLHNG